VPRDLGNCVLPAGGRQATLRAMKRNPQIIAFMTPFPCSIDVDAPLEEARAMMRDGHFHHLPVTCGAQLAGIVTDRDIMLLLENGVSTAASLGLKVRDAYVDNPCIVPASTPVALVARTMAEQHIGSAIVTKHDKLVGIFTVTDACRALADIIQGHPGDTSDAA
jgi:CBS domain-containing protein